MIDATLRRLYEYNESFRDRPGTCAACGFSLILDTHHYVPRALGGCDHDHNLVELCPNHHRLAHLYMRTLWGRCEHGEQRIAANAMLDWMMAVHMSHQLDPAEDFLSARIYPLAVALRPWVWAQRASGAL